MASMEPIEVKLHLDVEDFQRQLRQARREMGRAAFRTNPWWCLFWMLWGIGFGAAALYWTTTHSAGWAIFYGICAAIDFVCVGFWATTLIYERWLKI